MDNSESGDELAGTFLTTDTGYMVQTDDMDDEAVLTADNTDDSNHDGGHRLGDPLREQDRFLPIANVAKIMKKAIPENGKLVKYDGSFRNELNTNVYSGLYSKSFKLCENEGLSVSGIVGVRLKSYKIPFPYIAKDARECVQECVSEFISFITSEASDRCHAEKRKTINGEDILYAMTTLGFDNYVEPLKLYLQKYREATKGDKSLNPSDIYDEIGEDMFSGQTITGNLLEQNGQTETVIYTTFPGDQIQQFHMV